MGRKEFAIILSVCTFSQLTAALVQAADNRVLDVEVTDESRPSRKGGKVTSPKLEDLQEAYKKKAAHLHDLMSDYWHAKDVLAKAKKESFEVKRQVSAEEQLFRTEEHDRRVALEADWQAKADAERLARSQLGNNVREAFNLTDGSALTTSMLVDILMALPSAIQDKTFSSTVSQGVNETQTQVTAFLNHTKSRVESFSHAANSASDAELAYMMAKFFHENVMKLKALHRSTLQTVQRIKKVMPEKLKKNVAPLISSLVSQVAVLHVNASKLGEEGLGQACDTVSAIMSNISDYDSKLGTVHFFLQNVTTVFLPKLGQVSEMGEIETVFLDKMMSIANLETDALKEASNEVLTKVGPIVQERVHCTWSSARRRSTGLLSALLAALAAWLLL